MLSIKSILLVSRSRVIEDLRGEPSVRVTRCILRWITSTLIPSSVRKSNLIDLNKIFYTRYPVCPTEYGH